MTDSYAPANAGTRPGKSFLGMAVESLPEAFGIYTALRDDAGVIRDFRVEYVNPAACEALGLTREEQVGRGLCELFPDYQDSELLDAYRRVAEGGEPLHREDLVLRDGPDGSRILDVRISPLSEGVTALWRDVTDDARRRMDVDRSHRRIHDIVRQSADGIAVVDGDGRVLFANPAAELLLGRPPGQAVGYELGVPAADSIGTVLTLRRPGQEPAIVELEAVQTVWDVEPAYVVNLHDITERRAAEERARTLRQHLEEAYTELRRAQSVARVGSWRLDMEASTMHLGAVTAEIFGEVPGALVSHASYLARVHEDDRPAVEAAWQSALAGGSYDSEHRVVRGNEVRWVREQVVVEREGQRAVSAIGVVQDVTERKEREQEAQVARARAEQLNRVLRALQDVNRAIARATDAQQLMDEVASRLVATRGFAACWIGLRSEGRPMAQAGLAPAVFDALRRDYREDRLPRCIRRAEEGGVIACSPAREPSCASPTCAGQEGPPALTAAITHDGAYFGSLTVFLDPDQPEIRDQRSLLAAVADDLAFGLRALRTRAEGLRTERILRETERLAGVGGWVWDYETDRFTFSPEWLRIHGTTRREMDLDGLLGLCHPGDRDRWRQALERARSTGEFHHIEHRILRDDTGEERLVVAAGEATPAGEDDGRMFGMTLDVTDEHRVAAELREAKLQLETAIASGGVGLFDWDLVHNNVRFSREWKRQIGYEDHEIGEGPEEWESRFHPDDLGPTLERVREVLASEATSYEREFRFRHRDGHYLWIYTQATIIRDQDGTALRMLGTHIDITPLRNAQEERHQAEVQLFQSQKTESIGRLAGGVAHDFNNTLSVILGVAELVRSGLEPDDPLLSDFDEILAAARRGAGLTRQLLAFARKQTILPVVLDLNETISDMIRLLSRLIGEDIRIDWEPDPAVGPVEMDPGQVEQILVNLVVNARDAITGPGQITIRLRETTAPAPEGDGGDRENGGPRVHRPFVVVQVSDTGAGMDPATAAQVFEPFYTTKPTGEGTGLGLATVDGIVRQNGGFIELDTAPGEGATFRIHLPRVDGMPGHATAGPQRPSEGQGETVLLVEDEAPLLRLIQRYLQRLGYTVLAAGSPAQAIALARQHGDSIQLLLTDVVMPGMNGVELRDRIGQELPGVRALFMSGYTADILAERGGIGEGISLIEKPFSIGELGAKMRDVLDRD